MAPIFLPDLRLNGEISGPAGGPALVLLHALGLDLRIWDPLIAALPRHRILALDMRGHGASDVPVPPYTMGSLIRDVERAMDHHGMKDAVVLGLSIGGMIAQGLAVKRLDLVRGLILSNTAARIGTAAQWQARIDTVRAGGMEAIRAATMERWLGRNWQANPALPALQDRFMATMPDGWIGCANAIAGTDFYETTATLRLPALCIAGGNDGSTPADLVRETADLIPGSRFKVIPGAGHVPVAEKPGDYAMAVKDFLTAIGQV